MHKIASDSRIVGSCLRMCAGFNKPRSTHSFSIRLFGFITQILDGFAGNHFAIICLNTRKYRVGRVLCLRVNRPTTGIVRVRSTCKLLSARSTSSKTSAPALQT